MKAGVGHNQGPPLDPGRSWRRYCWSRARASLMPPAPIEVVRRRIRRAAELGLSYPQYASIVTVTGRDLTAYLVTSAALEGPGGTVRADAAPALGRLVRCEVLVLRTLRGPAVDAVTAALGRVIAATGIVGTVPERAPLRAGRDATAGLLRQLRLPPAAVAMIGSGRLEKDWAEAAGLARFLPAEQWFAGQG